MPHNRGIMMFFGIFQFGSWMFDWLYKGCSRPHVVSDQWHLSVFMNGISHMESIYKRDSFLELTEQYWSYFKPDMVKLNTLMPHEYFEGNQIAGKPLCTLVLWNQKGFIDE